MIISKNYFTINEVLNKVLFGEQSKEVGQTYLKFNIIDDKDSKYVCLNYYNFNILLDNTKNQNTIYHTLTDEFFEEFSVHKNKMHFCGTLSNNSFILTEINYEIEPKKMGIFVKKRIINGFKNRGIDITIPQNLNSRRSKITRMLIG